MQEIFNSPRSFRVWRYIISHETLIIQSIKDSTNKNNLVLIFSGVEFIQIPTTIKDGLAVHINEYDSNNFSNDLTNIKLRTSDKLFEIQTITGKYLIIAGQMRIFENCYEYLELLEKYDNFDHGEMIFNSIDDC